MKQILILLFILHVTLLADAPMLKASSYRFVEMTLGHGKAHFVEFGSESCYSCQVMGERLYRLKQANPALNIDFINVKEEREAAYKFKIRMIPTQIIYDENGEEVFRNIGIIEEEKLHELFNKYKI